MKLVDEIERLTATKAKKKFVYKEDDFDVVFLNTTEICIQGRIIKDDFLVEFMDEASMSVLKRSGSFDVYGHNGLILVKVKDNYKYTQ